MTQKTEHELSADAKRLLDGVNLDAATSRGAERHLARTGAPREKLVEARARRRKADEALALEVIGAPTALPSKQMRELAQSLREYKQIGLARRVLERAEREMRRDDDPGTYTKIYQKYALDTYKDPDLPLGFRLDRALEILRKHEDLSTTNDQETLGLAGAIFKRKWQADGRRRNLDRSLFYYLRGYAAAAPDHAKGDILGYLEHHPELEISAADQGYTGINAALVLDWIAALEDEEALATGMVSSSARQKREHAQRIRTEITRSVVGLHAQPGSEWLKEEWWYYSTLGEAFFGLGNYEEALRWLVDAPAQAQLTIADGNPLGLEVPDWEYESTAYQLAALARLQYAAQRAGSPRHVTETEFEQTDAGFALSRFLRRDDKALKSAFRGKLGLALSGGGFRASFFHIGVLARLAELDILRHVEVLSCVSGGSIVGAHYYLELRRLLEERPDGEIEPEAYIAIVRRVERHFLLGVQRNIRTRVLAELGTNLKMMFLPGYSRTLRVGELYEKELYSQIGNDGDPVRVHDPKPIYLKDLLIKPAIRGGDGQLTKAEHFNPRGDNFRRECKVPALILNAATLNTGHNWQFTATYMGEPPMPLNTKIAANYRLRRLYHEDAPPGFPPVRLGHAVAASSCVPGLFEPLALDDLYPDAPDRDGSQRKRDKRTIRVRLVDGGVCDNQGIMSLLEQDCTSIIVSDGSGQMEQQDHPSAGVLAVPLRSNDILQARIRESQYADLASRYGAGIVREFVFLHLKQGLGGDALAWHGCPPARKLTDFAPPERRAATLGVTDYGVAPEVQRSLAAVRTDLDSFCDAEAYALMACAYRMTLAELAPRDGEPDRVEALGGVRTQRTTAWRFSTMERNLAPRGPERELLDRILKASEHTGFKVWHLSTGLKWFARALGLAVAVGVCAIFFANWNLALAPGAGEVTYGILAGFMGSLALGAVAAAVAARVFGKRLGKDILRVIQWRETLRNVLIGAGMSLFGWIVARVHLHFFDRLYLRYGRIQNFGATSRDHTPIKVGGAATGAGLRS